MAVFTRANAEPGFYRAGGSVDGFSQSADAFSISSAPDNQAVKRERCLRAGRIIGGAAGSMMGMAQIYWSATGMSGVHGPVWKNVVTGVPSSLIGGYVGVKMTEWMTGKLLDDKPGPGRAVWRGALYGAAAGAVTFTTEMIPLLIIGHYMDTIHFNMDQDLIVFKLLGASVLGGLVYGGTFGAMGGAVYGPCISWYMDF
ncbi:MAG: hypothetical protein H8E46_12115 [FCB group bacterium]|nr:hypothetical protein [FCB group bacterium]